MIDFDSTLDDLLAEWEQRRHTGEEVTPDHLCRDRPDLLPALQQRIAELRATDWLFESGDDTTLVRDHQTAEHPRQLGKYVILECLGAGGMGTVYKARHRKLDKLVALKLLPEVRLWDRQAVARFEREMRAVGKLEHPHLVLAHDAGEVNGTHYLAMQLIDGIDVGLLAKRLGTLRPADACEIARQAALGLQAAHEQGLVHRDVKPSNLMLGPDGVVKVLDLGLARLTDTATDAAPAERISTSGKVMGTLDYMAPEQCDDCHAADPRADIYGLGATLYKLLCGQAPLEGDRPGTTFQKVRALAAGNIPSLRTRRPDLPAALIQYVDRMLSKNPVDRPGSAAEVAARLADFAQSSDLRMLSRQANAATSNSNETLTRENGTVAEDCRPEQVGAVPAEVGGRRNCADLFRPTTVSRSLRIAAGLLSVAVLLALAAVIAIQTDKGTLTITGDGVTVEQLKEAGVRLVHKQSQQTYDLKIGSQRQKSGDYLIEVTQQPSGLEFSTPEFTLARGTLREIRVTFKPAETIEVVNERWAFVQRLMKDGLRINVTLPDGIKRGIQSSEELRLIRHVACYGSTTTEENIGRLLSFTSLTELEFSSTPPLTKPTFEAIGRQTELRTLSFNVCLPVNDESLAQFKNLTKLTSLMLWGTSITDDGLAHLQHFPELESVQLGENKRITGSGLLSLKPLAKLNWLSLHGTGLTDDGLKHMRELPQVKMLALGGQTRLTNAGLKELAGLTNMEEILFDKSELSDEGLTHLAQLPNLKKLRTRQSKVTADGLTAFRAALPQCELEAE